jgi:5'-deoxynucleotidase YfbR-like HD superfamily hydrolase
MKNRIGDWALTFTGRRFWPLSPRIEDLDIDDIAHALSNICRFGGHCREFYSVAQHSVLVSRLVPEHLAFTGLMHDATEAYLGDMVRPLKYSLPQFLEIEDALWRVIARRFELPLRLPAEVKEADEIALMTERRDLIVRTPEGWGVQAEPAKETIVPLAPAEAREEFIQRYRNLLYL